MKRKHALIAAIVGLVSTVALAGKPVQAPKIEGLGVFAAGTLIGRLLANGDSRWPLLISSTGYPFKIDVNTGSFVYAHGTTMYFSGTNCTGDAYFTAGDAMVAQGLVLRVNDTLLYLRRGSLLGAPRTVASSYTSGNICTNTSETISAPTAVLLPNDPAVSGVSSVQFGLPIVYGVP